MESPSPHSRTALVTGASRGIGAAIARALAADGTRVALLARSAAALEALAADIGGGAVAIECDLSDSAAVAAAVEATRAAFGDAPDILVNNAGAFRLSTLDSMPVESFREAITTNLMAPFTLIRAFVGDMRARRSGHVVTIGSIADRFAFPGNGAYAASKFGVRGLHEVLLTELRGSGVRASLISPSAVDTDLWDPIDTEGADTPFPPRASMLSAVAVAEAVMFAVTRSQGVNVDELRMSSG